MPEKITRVDDEIIFPVEFDTDGKKETIWVRAAYSNNISQKSKAPNSIDERITKLLGEAGAGGGGDKEPPSTKKTKSPEPDKKGSGPKEPTENAKQITAGMFAKFSENRKEIEKESILISSGA